MTVTHIQYPETKHKLITLKYSVKGKQCYKSEHAVPKVYKNKQLCLGEH